MGKRGIFSLLGALIAFAASGCSPEYSAERMYWHAQRAAEPVSKDPLNATPQQASRAIEGFQAVVDRAGGTSSAARAQFAIGSLHMMRQEYALARDAYKLAIRNYGQYRQFAYAARIALIKAYQALNDRSGALAAYKEIISEHPWTAIGIEAPLLLAESARRQGAAQEAEANLRAAAAHYQRLAGHAPSKEADLRIRGQLLSTYQRLGEWDKAVEILEDLSREKDGVNRPMVLLTMAALYETQLHRQGQARAIYQQLVKDYADQPAGQEAARRLEGLSLAGKIPESAEAAPAIPEKLLILPQIEESVEELP